VEGLGERLMSAIGDVVPVLPVPLVAKALGEGAISREDLAGRVTDLIARLETSGAVLNLPPGGPDAVLAEGLEPMVRRGLVTEDLKPVEKNRALLAFYAAAVPDLAAVAAMRQT
jgi:glycerol-3-phosphate O-acyltransferase